MRACSFFFVAWFSKPHKSHSCFLVFMVPVTFFPVTIPVSKLTVYLANDFVHLVTVGKFCFHFGHELGSIADFKICQCQLQHMCA